MEDSTVTMDKINEGGREKNVWRAIEKLARDYTHTHTHIHFTPTPA